MIMKVFLFVTLVLFSFSVFAGKIEHNCSSESYGDAMKSDCFIKFDMESTKAGFITTSFTGVVKKFSTIFNWNGEEFANTLLKIKIADIDTDNSARDSKMNEETFSSDKFSDLVVQIGGPLNTGIHKNVPGLLTVRGKIKEITLNLEITVSKDKDYVIKGDTKMSIKQLELPDPSIFIASVRDRVDLNFQIKGKLD